MNVKVLFISLSHNINNKKNKKIQVHDTWNYVIPIHDITLLTHSSGFLLNNLVLRSKRYQILVHQRMQ